MQYQLVKGENGERLWLPLLAGAAIISAPLWLNNNKCCGNNQGYQAPLYAYPYPYPYPVYQSNYYPYYGYNNFPPTTQITYNGWGIKW